MSKKNLTFQERAAQAYLNFEKAQVAQNKKTYAEKNAEKKAKEAREKANQFDQNRTTIFQVPKKDKTWSDWRRDREELSRLKAEAEEAEQRAAAIAATVNQHRANSLSLDILDKRINAPGADKDSNIGYYRTAYDQKKSRQETKNLPKNVINLLDQYNKEDTNSTADAYASVFAAMTGQKSGVNFTSGAKKAQIGQELERMGYSNYKDLAAYRKYITDAKTNEKTQKEFENFAKEHPTVAAASARLLSPTATVTGFGGWIKNNVNGSPLQSPNAKGADFQLSRAKNTIDDTVSNSFEDGKLSKKAKAFLYQTGMSGIDSLTASLLGRGGGALLGAGALVDSYIDASDKGASKNQAFWSSALSGIAESLFESFSIGQLKAMKEIAPKSLRDIIKNIGKSTVTNFSEEAATEVANILSDYLVNGGISDYQQQVNDKIRAGYSKDEAKKSTLLSMGKRVLEAGAGGALMGAAFGGIGSVSGKISYDTQLKERGKSLSEYGGEEKLLASAYQFGTDGDEKLAKAANAVEQNRNELFRKTEEFESAKAAVDNRLAELGESKKNIQEISQTAVKAIFGEKLSAKDKRAIKNSKYGQRVINEISAAYSENGGGTTSKWAKEVIDNIGGTQDAKNEKATTRPEYTSKELRQIGKLEEALAEHTEETAKGSVKMAVEDRLTELGESKKSIKKISEATVKAVLGKELSARERNAIRKSNYGSTVINEVSAAEVGNNEYASDWVTDMKNDISGIYDAYSSPNVDAYRNRIYEGESTGSETAAQQSEAGTNTNGTERYLKRTDMSEETLKTMDELREDGQDREAFEKSFEAYYSMGKSGYSKEEAMASKNAAATSDFSDFQKEKAFELGQAAKEVQSQVKLSSISKIGKNDTLVLDENGNEVSLFEVNADRGVKLLFNKAAKLGDVEAANAFLGGYETGMDVNLYEKSFSSFNAAGRQNQNISFEQFINEHGDMKELYDYIKPETAYAAFETGAQYAKLNSTEQPKAQKRSARSEGAYTNNTTAAETDAVFEATAKKLGVQIVKEESLWSEDGREANAQFIPSQMKILISSQAQSEFTDTIHELGHLAESYNGEKMASVRGALFSWYVDKNGYSSLEDMIGKFQEDYGTSRENAIEEMTNEALSGLFSTDEGVNDFLNWLKEDSGYSKAEKKSVLQRIIEFFDRIVEAVKQTIKDGDLSQTAREFAQMQTDKAAQIREMFLDALDGIDGKKRENAESKTKDSRKRVDFDEKIDKDKGKAHNKKRRIYNEQETLFMIWQESASTPIGEKKAFERGNAVILYEKTEGGCVELSRRKIKKEEQEYERTYRKTNESFNWYLEEVESDMGRSEENNNFHRFAGNTVRSGGQTERERLQSDTKRNNEHLLSSDNRTSDVTDSEETKNSLKRTDSEGTVLSAEQQEFFKNSKVRDEEGNLLVVYHGTDDDFTVFDRTKGRSTMVIQGSFFSPWELDASGYGSNVKAYYLNIKNPASEGVAYKALNRFKGQNNAGVKAREYLESLGYDGVENSGEEYIAFNSQQIKSIDNLSPTENPDIRYSLRHSLGISDSTAEESLVAQNEEYRKLIGELQTQLGKRHFVDTKKVQTLARVIKEDYRSTIRTDELTDMLGSFYSSIANNKGLSWDVVKIKTREIAEAVVSKSKNMTEISEKSRSVINDIRSVAIKLSDEQKAEVASYYGSYNNFRRSTFGTLKIRNDGISLDQRFSELSETYPYIFSKETADVDQPTALFEAAKALKNGYYDENGFDRDSAVDFLAADIYEKYFEIPDSKSLEDDYRLKLNAEKVKLRGQLEKAKAQIKEENDIALRAARAEYAENLSDIREEYDEKFLQNKARYEQRVQKIADTNSRAQQRKAIIRKVKRFSNMLLKTSTKGGYVGEKDGRKLVIYNNIPEELRPPVAALCEIFADDNSVFDFEKLDELKSSYAAIRANTPAEETYLSGIYDAEIEEELERLKKTISGKRLAQLSQRQLGTIKNVLDHFDAMIKNETEIFVNGRTKLVKDVGTQTLSELKAKGKKRQRQLGKLQNSADMTKKFAVNNLKPVYFFEKVGGEFKTLYWDLHKGQDKYVRNVEAAKDFVEKTVEKFGADKWLKENDKVTFTTVRKEKLALTLEQRLLIYATAKREQLSGQNSLHLMSGGVVFENQIQKNKDKTKPWKFRDEDAQAHPLALEDITKIVGSLTESQKKFADELVGYLSGDMAQLGNEVSMKLYGYRKFNERYYIPFNSAQSFGFQRFGEQGESLLRSLSFTKQTVRGAATPLVLSDFTEVVAKHIERMSAYNALVVPLENMGKVWNFKTVTSDSEIGASVASQFETAFGKEYRDYFVQFVKDVNGNVMSDSREEVYNSFLRKFKKSAVFASASVTIQQPSAVCRAFAEVNPIYFAASTFDSRKSYDECMKYAPIAQLKEIGGFDTSSGRNMVDFLLEAKNQPKGKEKFKAFFTDSDFRDNVLSAAPGLADRVTWAHIWNAVKRETKAKTGLSGERLLEKAGERFTEVIEKTQVYDSVLTRSGNMRSKSGAMQTVTAFMAEPTTTVNMLYDAAINARQDPKKFFRVYSSVLCATLFNAALKSIITATRDDDEEKTNLEKYIAQVVGNFMNDLNPATLIPFVRDIYSLFTGYDVSRSDVDMVSNLVDAIKKCTSGDSVPLDKKITSLAGALGDFLGIPAKNIIRDIYSVKTAVKDIKAPGKTTAKGIKFAIQAEIFPSLKNLNLLDEASRKEKLYEAWLDKDAETYERLAKSYKSGTAIKDALTDEIKNDYLDGTITAEKAEELLSPFFDEKNKAYYKIREWDDGEEESEEEEDKNSGFYQLDTAKVKPKEKKKKEKTTNILLKIQGKDAEVEDEEEDSDEPYAKFTYLEEAVKASDAAAFKKEAADLRKHGISQDTIEAKTKTYLKNDKQVVAAGKRYAKGDVSALDESERIANKYGIEKRTVQAAIRSVAGIKTYSDSLTDGTDNIYADMHTAIAAGDNEAAAEIAGELIKAKIAENIAKGKSADKAKNDVYYGVRSSIASNWKEAYLKASSTKRAEIRASLYATGAYESLYALDKTLANWRDG